MEELMDKLLNEIILALETVHMLGYFQTTINEVLRKELKKANNVKQIILLEQNIGAEYRKEIGGRHLNDDEISCFINHPTVQHIAVVDFFISFKSTHEQSETISSQYAKTKSYGKIFLLSSGSFLFDIF